MCIILLNQENNLLDFRYSLKLCKMIGIIMIFISKRFQKEIISVVGKYNFTFLYRHQKNDACFVLIWSKFAAKTVLRRDLESIWFNSFQWSSFVSTVSAFHKIFMNSRQTPNYWSRTTIIRKTITSIQMFFRPGFIF